MTWILSLEVTSIAQKSCFDRKIRMARLALSS